MFNINVVGTKNLLQTSQGQKFIYLSSTAAMGKKLKEIPATEETPCIPSNYYGQTKLEAEGLVRKAGGIVIRSADIMGPGFEEGYNYVLSRIAEERMVIPGNGKNFIQWVHIKDLVQALLLAKEKGKLGEVYIIAGKEVRTLNECFALLGKLFYLENG
jgi:nucleoside-diphosphate-sugar epimerase